MWGSKRPCAEPSCRTLAAQTWLEPEEELLHFLREEQRPDTVVPVGVCELQTMRNGMSDSAGILKHMASWALVDDKQCLPSDDRLSPFRKQECTSPRMC